MRRQCLILAFLALLIVPICAHAQSSSESTKLNSYSVAAGVVGANFTISGPYDGQPPQVYGWLVAKPTDGSPAFTILGPVATPGPATGNSYTYSANCNANQELPMGSCSCEVWGGLFSGNPPSTEDTGGAITLHTPGNYVVSAVMPDSNGDGGFSPAGSGTFTMYALSESTGSVVGTPVTFHTGNRIAPNGQMEEYATFGYPNQGSTAAVDAPWAQGDNQGQYYFSFTPDNGSGSAGVENTPAMVGSSLPGLGYVLVEGNTGHPANTAAGEQVGQAGDGNASTGASGTAASLAGNTGGTSSSSGDNSLTSWASSFWQTFETECQKLFVPADSSGQQAIQSALNKFENWGPLGMVASYQQMVQGQEAQSNAAYDNTYWLLPLQPGWLTALASNAPAGVGLPAYYDPTKDTSASQQPYSGTCPLTPYVPDTTQYPSSINLGPVHESILIFRLCELLWGWLFFLTSTLNLAMKILTNV